MQDDRAVGTGGLAPTASESSLLEHQVFLGQALDAAQQSLFFIGLMAGVSPPWFRRTGPWFDRAIEAYRPFARHQVRALVRAVHLRPLDPALAAAVPQMAHAHRCWQRIFDSFESRELEMGGEQLRRLFVDFVASAQRAGLGLSQTHPRLARLLRAVFKPVPHLRRLPLERPLPFQGSPWLGDLLRFLRRNLAAIWAIFLILSVYWTVEPIRALFLNEGRAIWLPLALLALPALVARIASVATRRRHPGKVPYWDLAGPTFRSLRFSAVEPRGLVERWSGGAELPGRILCGHAVKTVAYAGWWLASALLLSLFQRFAPTSESSVTVMLILVLFGLIVVAARGLDFWDFLSAASIRFLGLLGAACCLALLIAGGGYVLFKVLFGLAALACLIAFFYFQLVPPRRPLWLVGGLLFAVLALSARSAELTRERAVWSEKDPPPSEARWERLEKADWPYAPHTGAGETLPPVVVMAASGGGSRAALYTALTLRRLAEDPELGEAAKQLQAISSVSGGSLANAAYVVRRLDRPTGGGRADDSGVNDLAEVVGHDFLLPTLLGALLPLTSRGDEIEKEWRDGDIGLGDRRLSSLADRWRWAVDQGLKVPPFPVPLFNTTSLDGHYMVVSPFARDLYTRSDQSPARLDFSIYETGGDPAGGPFTWVYDRDAIYGLEDLLPHYDPLLSSAVRASANFPFGFPLVKIRTKRPLVYSPDPKLRRADRIKEVALTDGGAFSNSGMWPLCNLLLNRREALWQRGVLLIVVDASRMPQHDDLGRAVQRLWGTINDQAPIGQAVHRLMIDRLRDAYGDRIAVVQIDLVPREHYNVMTTWALDDGSRSRLEKSFERRWREERPRLLEAWNYLSGKGQSPPSRPIADRRPPLD